MFAFEIETGEVIHNKSTEREPSSVATLSTTAPRSLSAPTSSLSLTKAETPGV